MAHARIPCIGRFPDPHDLVADAGMDVVIVPLPGRTEIADAATIWVSPHDDQREFGSRIFRGLASAIIGPTCRTRAQICSLASWLAAPPELVALVGGLEEAIAEQTWATDEMIRSWWALM